MGIGEDGVVVDVSSLFVLGENFTNDVSLGEF